MKGHKQVYSVISSDQDHTTISFTINAAGGIVSPRVIFSGVHKMSKLKMKLSKDEKLGSSSILTLLMTGLNRKLILISFRI